MAQPVRILLVDDEPDTLKAIGKRLELAGLEVVTARDGVEALEQAERSAPHLIVLDLILPKLDGYEVCRALRAKPQFSQTPIIVLTARDQQQDKVYALNCGADVYLTKPYRADVLLQMIQIFLPGSNAGR